MRKTTIISLLLVLISIAGLLAAYNAVSLYAGMAQWIPLALTLSLERGAKIVDTTAWCKDGSGKLLSSSQLFSLEQKKWHETLMASRLSAPAIIKHSVSYPSLGNTTEVASLFSTEVQRASGAGEIKNALSYSFCHYTIVCQFIFHHRAQQGISLRRLREGLPLLERALVDIELASDKADYSPSLFRQENIGSRLASLIKVFPFVYHACARENLVLASIPVVLAENKGLSTVDVPADYLNKRSRDFLLQAHTFKDHYPSAKKLSEQFTVRLKDLKENVGGSSPSFRLIFSSLYDLKGAFVDIMLATLPPKDLLKLFKKECEIRSRLITLYLKWQQKNFIGKNKRPAIELPELNLPTEMFYEPLSGKKTRLLPN